MVKAQVITPLDTYDLQAYIFLTLESCKRSRVHKAFCGDKDWGNQEFVSSSEIAAPRNDGFLL